MRTCRSKFICSLIFCMCGRCMQGGTRMRVRNILLLLYFISDHHHGSSVWLSGLQYFFSVFSLPFLSSPHVTFPQSPRGKEGEQQQKKKRIKQTNKGTRNGSSSFLFWFLRKRSILNI
ncbi:hypothetical protein, unlikely [Trypanosoma brucei gambiense DAL972]|uniref:Uncharacterized protein n=1 Tax=Trypanosoma brucei gambiense (strain MHOM/CI/86/DAL972) TaxID=679716 RepID=C9ZWK1_TRYB9|nr:hypothetical protein, unlikely [Trypanosoma brucei gambiense DAL972]CBH13790.1 hypothetical protein, unlikely [Trypanosoma brucei gambiense DAL972]|eukprot:XP_011776066.1 hypothetical protein, unlikely [Trypanosoma brucei gambiense DAL972]